MLAKILGQWGICEDTRLAPGLHFLIVSVCFVHMFVSVCVCVCVSKVLFLVHSGLPALQWVYSSRVLQKTGLMTSSRDMKRLCPPATRILRPGCVCDYVCVYFLCRRLITMPLFLCVLSKKTKLKHACTCHLILGVICRADSHAWTEADCQQHPCSLFLTCYRHHTTHVSPKKKSHQGAQTKLSLFLEKNPLIPSNLVICRRCVWRSSAAGTPRDPLAADGISCV